MSGGRCQPVKESRIAAVIPDDRCHVPEVAPRIVIDDAEHRTPGMRDLGQISPRPRDERRLGGVCETPCPLAGIACVRSGKASDARTSEGSRQGR